MRAPPENANGACQGAAADQIGERHHQHKPVKRGLQPRSEALGNSVICVIEKSPSAQVRIVLQEWRGDRQVTVREFTPGALPGSFWPNDKGVTLDVVHLEALAAGLQAALDDAQRRGWL